jgi:RHS repeat-associated protein
MASANGTRAFGRGWASSTDFAVNGWGDTDGYHIAVARERDGFVWHQIATLDPAALDAPSWVGYQCVSGNGRFAAVAILPSNQLNNPNARENGAYAYSVDIRSGAVHPIAAGVSLWYHSPGCGLGDRAVFTRNVGTDQRQTQALTVDLSSGRVVGSVMTRAELSSVVPVGNHVVGAIGPELVRLPLTGGFVTATPVAHVRGLAYSIRPTSDGGADFLSTLPQGATSTLWHLRGPKLMRLGDGRRTTLAIFQGLHGRHVLTGAASLASRRGIRALDSAALPDGAVFSSVEGDALFGNDRALGQRSPELLASHSGVIVRIPVSGAPARATTVLPPLLTRAGTKAPRRVQRALAAALTLGSATCSVPRLSPNRQVLQPNSQQVNWAVDLGVQNALPGSANTDFPAIGLSSPSGSNGTVPPLVVDAIMAQESNWNQASWHALPGVAGDPLVADYYGAAGSISSINYSAADCGYGIMQVTTGMRASDTQFTAAEEAAVATKTSENVAAGLQILASTWNQLYSAGVVANGGDPQKLENWYFAAWAYNTGFHAQSGSNPWGLGWTNNPQNSSWNPSRAPFLRNTYGDAAHPGDWPYQEKIMGWMGRALLDTHANPNYTPAVYHGTNTWMQLPGFSSFCDASDECSPTYLNGSLSYCQRADRECWWHQPATWVTSCSSNCATSPSQPYGSGSNEPATSDPYPPTCNIGSALTNSSATGPAIVVGSEQLSTSDLNRLDQSSDTLTLTTSNPSMNVVGCNYASGSPSADWSPNNGTFALTPGANSSGDPVGIIDTHQLGAGFGGHIWFTHTRSASSTPSLIQTGTWTPTLPSSQYYEILVHIPTSGATASDVVYTVNPDPNDPHPAAPWKIRVNQHLNRESWIALGTFGLRVNTGANVTLTNNSAMTPGGYDVAYDAAAFIPLGGNIDSGTPLGGPPTVLEEPGGSNPSWLQCTCARRHAGDPVDTATGYFSQGFHDLSTPGRGVPLDFSRTYNSALADPAGPNGSVAVNGPFGYGWSFTYGLHTRADPSTGNVTVYQEDGSTVLFIRSGTTYAPSAPREDATLVASGSNYVFTRKAKTIFTFDQSTGHLLSVQDLVGANANPRYATTLSYDGSGQLSTITDPGGRSYSLTWGSGKIQSVADTTGRQVDYRYNDAGGNLTDVYGVGTTRSGSSLGDQDHIQFTYFTGSHLLKTMRQPDFYGSTATPTPVTSMVYDASERVTSQTDALGNTTTFIYGPDSGTGIAAGQTLITDPNGDKVLDTYDSNTLLTSETRAYGTSQAATTNYTYDPVSLGITSVTDPNGNTQNFTYDTHGNRLSASDGSGETTTFTYDQLNDLTSTTDPIGNQRLYFYDEAGHISTGSGTWNSGALIYGVLTSEVVQQANGLVTPYGGTTDADAFSSETRTYFYDQASDPGDETRIVSGNGNAAGASPSAFTTNLTYDSYGDLAGVTDPLGHQTLYGYDTGRGLKATSVSPRGVAASVNAGCTPPAIGCSRYAHDIYGNVTTTTNALGKVTTVAYDADGNLVSTTDALQHTTQNIYDADNRLTKTVRPDTTHIDYAYDGAGNMLSQTDASGRRSAYTYNHRDLRITTTDASNKTTTISYDANGNPLTVTSPSGVVTTYTYNSTNELAGTSYSSGDPGVTYTFDPNGRRLTMVDGTGTTSYHYDGYGNLTSETNGAGQKVSYTFDFDNDPIAILYPNGQSVSRTYNAADQLTAITDWAGHTTTITPDGDGNVSTIAAPSALDSYTYDGVGQITGVTYANATQYASLTYGRNDDGQLASQASTGLPGAASHTFGYDALGRLSSDSALAGSFTYDGAGNPTQLGNGTRQAYSGGGQLCAAAATTPSCANPSAGTTTYGYDAQGNRTSTSAPSGTTTYNFNSESELVSVAKPSTALYVPIAPTRIADTRTSSGFPYAGQTIASGGSLTVQVTGANGDNVPANAVAVVLDLAVQTTTSSSANMYVSPAGQGQSVSPVLLGASGTVNNNLVTVGIGTNGQVTVFNSAGSTNITLDVAGYYVTKPATGNQFTPVIPARLADTRAASGYQDAGSTLTAGGTMNVQVTGNANVPSGATAAVVELTTIGGTATTTLTSYAQGATAPSIPNLYAASGANRAVEAVVPLSSGGGITVKNSSGSVNVTVDVVGYFSSAGSQLVATTPTRIADTRTGSGRPYAGSHIAAGGTLTIQVTNASGDNVPSTATAVILNLTSVNGTAASSLSVYPAGATGAVVTNVPFATGQIAKNEVTVGIGTSGQVTIANAAGTTDVTVDVEGYFQPEAQQTVASYVYNGDAMRMSKTVGSTTSRFAYDTNASTPQILTDGSWNYIYGGTGADGQPVLVEQIGVQSGTAYFIHRDELGSTIAITDSTGAVVGTFAYDPYGNRTGQTGTVSSPIGYAAGYSDSETGLVYLINRYYDPSTSLFVSVDPYVGATAQAYAYAGSDPMNSVDPLGLWCWPKSACNAAHAVVHAGGQAVGGASHYVGAHAGEISAVTGAAAVGVAFIPVVGEVAAPVLGGVSVITGAIATRHDIAHHDYVAAMIDGAGTMLGGEGFALDAGAKILDYGARVAVDTGRPFVALARASAQDARYGGYFDRAGAVLGIAGYEYAQFAPGEPLPALSPSGVPVIEGVGGGSC